MSYHIVSNSLGKNEIVMSKDVADAMKKMRRFMFERVYTNPIAKAEEEKAEMLMKTLFSYYVTHTEKLPKEYQSLMERGDSKERVTCDYIGAMTDRYAISRYEELFIPKSWHY